jgi:hypothetical protein
MFESLSFSLSLSHYLRATLEEGQDLGLLDAISLQEEHVLPRKQHCRK